MANSQSEYQRFLVYLEGRNVADDVRKLANIIWTYLPNLAEVGAVRRARSSRLAPLALDLLERTPTQSPVNLNNQTPAVALGRLQELVVGPFRGFMSPETFNLSHDITLVYGANGTGKSSFCEALEAALLGSISEAQVKRIEHRQYCNNVRLRRHVPPLLTAMNQSGQVATVATNENEYRFCFIEKNRLDDFARIAAKTPGDQRQLIATLFGVDQFSDFVRGFNQTLDENLHLTGHQALQLEARRRHLESSNQIILNYPAKLDDFARREYELAQCIYPSSTYQDCVIWIEGTPAQQGRLAFLQSQLDAVPPPSMRLLKLSSSRCWKMRTDVIAKCRQPRSNWQPVQVTSHIRNSIAQS